MAAKTPSKSAPKKKGKAQQDECATPEEKADKERFVRDVLTRGEAARPDEHGNLPPGATHEIVEEPEGELPKIKRKRFSMV
jgi:hypothetical protein